MQCVIVRCSVLQCVAVCCNAVCCSALQCIAVCCSVWQCAAVRCSVQRRDFACATGIYFAKTRIQGSFAKEKTETERVSEREIERKTEGGKERQRKRKRREGGREKEGYRRERVRRGERGAGRVHAQGEEREGECVCESVGGRQKGCFSNAIQVQEDQNGEKSPTHSAKELYASV